MSLLSRLRFILPAAATLLLLASSAHACVICLPYPQKSVVDHVIESDTVVFAREDIAKPLSYAPVETLKGTADGSIIPLLLDARTHRQLQLDRRLRAVLVEDRPGGTWTFLGLAGSEYQAVLRQVVGWPAKTPAERARFFARHLEDDDREMAELAFLEVARAPYATIRDLEASVTRDDLYRVINDWFRIEWHGLYILMLGMSDRPDDIDFVRQKLLAAARFGLTANLGAYATAYIEMNGADAVKAVADEYLSGRSHSDAELIEIVKALSAQGNSGRAELRAAILDAYDRLIAHSPRLAGYVANDLLDWQVTRFAPRMRTLLDDVALDEASRLAIAAYVSSADDRQRSDASSERLLPNDSLIEPWRQR